MTETQKRREELYGLLGRLPDRDRAVSAETVAIEERGSYVLEKLRLDLNGMEAVPAYFVRPLNAQPSCPTILYNHSLPFHIATVTDAYLAPHHRPQHSVHSVLYTPHSTQYLDTTAIDPLKLHLYLDPA